MLLAYAWVYFLSFDKFDMFYVCVDTQIGSNVMADNERSGMKQAYGKKDIGLNAIFSWTE